MNFQDKCEGGGHSQRCKAEVGVASMVNVGGIIVQYTVTFNRIWISRMLISLKLNEIDEKFQRTNRQGYVSTREFVSKYFFKNYLGGIFSRLK